MIEIQYFGKIRELVQCDLETIDWQGADTDALLVHLRGRGEPWASALAHHQVYKIALNHRILHSAQSIPEGAHIGILPPVTGG
ncbi:MAG: MoaD/ThiS family protein [Formosimonas sp.]|jgi:molybdopterin synthase sulfur carrier subunit